VVSYYITVSNVDLADCQSLILKVISGHYSFVSYMIAVAPVLTAAVLAICYTLYFNIRTVRNEVLKDFQIDLREIEDLATLYWLGNHSSSWSRKKLQTIGHQIRAKLNASADYRELYIKVLREKERNEYRSLDTRLFRVATGGNFQTSKMDNSPETYAEIVDIIFQMKDIARFPPVTTVLRDLVSR
jgi:hypothetical protein